MPSIDQHTRERVIFLWQNGNSQNSISNQLKISRCAVQSIIRKHTIYGTTNNLPRSGRPAKTTLRDQRTLVLLSKRHPKWTPGDLIKCWKPSQSVSSSTAKRVLLKYGLFAHVAAKKPHLTKWQRHLRISWCHAYQHWTPSMWENVIFSDESQILLRQSSRQFVRRPAGYRFNHRLTTKTVKFGGGGIIVWGAIKSDGKRVLVKAQETINSTEYQRLLSSGLMPLLDSSSIFQQDGAPSHRSKATMQFLDRHKICVLSDWPPQSPDLNIIENLWADVKRKLAAQKFKSKDDLWSACLKAWNEIPNETIQKLFDSIPKRLISVIKNHGYPTKY